MLQGVGMHELSVEASFSAAHRLPNYPGKCARWHGHNWAVAVFIRATQLDELGMAVDFRRVKEALGELLERFDHTDLNQVPELAGVNPTCEVLARHLYHELCGELNDERCKVVRVRVSETAGTSASYFE